MKRAGFTMIELIFVIIILGILAAVALPKFLGVSEQAESEKCLAAVGTMNRTVGPALWSESLVKGGKDKGSLLQGVAPFNNHMTAATEILRQFEIPSACLSIGDNTDPANISAAWLPTKGKGTRIPIGAKEFVIEFTDGSSISPPEWKWTDVTGKED